jgi:hypothetical protein
MWILFNEVDDCFFFTGTQIRSSGFCCSQERFAAALHSRVSQAVHKTQLQWKSPPLRMKMYDEV